MTGEVLAGPLNTEAGPAGALVAIACAAEFVSSEHEELLEVLLEPFTVALENDRRLRELTALREKVEAENRSLLTKLGRNDLSDAIVGVESGLRPVMDRVSLVARADIPVLILGETGSGKEVVARAIHKQSRRPSGPFLRVNCGAIPPELVDSELFGHERGSFTGATGLRKGWFERADQGHAVSGRVRRIAAGRPGALAANFAGRHVRARRRRAANARRRARRGGHASQFASDGRRRNDFAKTCGIGWPCSRSICRRCAIGRKIFRRWQRISRCEPPNDSACRAARRRRKM